MAYKISGRVLQVEAPRELPSNSGKLYTIGAVVITVRKFDQYTGEPTEDPDNTPRFQFIGEKCSQLNGVKPGDIVTVHFDISGRSYDKDGKTSYFTDVRPFRIDIQHTPSQATQTPNNDFNQPQQPITPSETQNAPQAAQNAPQIKTDDLPF